VAAEKFRRPRPPTYIAPPPTYTPSPPTHTSSPPTYNTVKSSAGESMGPRKKEGIRDMIGLGALEGACVAALCLTNPIGWAGLAIAGGVSASWGLLAYVAFDNE